MFARYMKITAVTFTVLTIFLASVYQLFPRSWCLASAISAGVTAYHFVMRLMIGWLVPLITGYRMNYCHPWFRPRSWEPKLYQALRLRKLKKYLPTYDPRQYDLTHNTLLQIILNTCGSEIVHETIMIFSFLPLVLVPVFGELYVFLITSIAAALVDSLFVMAQRYNRPRLIRLYEKQKGCTQ